jgi:hypothetical protein
MKTMKTFEEYKYFNFNFTSKDPNEPFFIGPKKRYKDALKLQREQQNRIENDERIRQYNLAKRQKANMEVDTITEYIDIFKNHSDLISKGGYVRDEKNTNIKYGVLLKNGNQVISCYRISNHLEKFSNVVINGVTMENLPPEQIEVRPEDPLGEEIWDDNLKNLSEILGDLVKQYVRNNEIIF